jgi:hypothetical protein
MKEKTTLQPGGSPKYPFLPDFSGKVIHVPKECQGAFQIIGKQIEGDKEHEIDALDTTMTCGKISIQLFPDMTATSKHSQTLLDQDNMSCNILRQTSTLLHDKVFVKKEHVDSLEHKKVQLSQNMNYFISLDDDRSVVTAGDYDEPRTINPLNRMQEEYYCETPQLSYSCQNVGFCDSNVHPFRKSEIIPHTPVSASLLSNSWNTQIHQNIDQEDETVNPLSNEIKFNSGYPTTSRRRSSLQWEKLLCLAERTWNVGSDPFEPIPL